MSMESGDSDSARRCAGVGASLPAPHLRRQGGLLEQRYERRPQHLGRGYPLERLAHVRPFFSVEIEQS